MGDFPILADPYMLLAISSLHANRELGPLYYVTLPAVDYKAF